VCASVRGRVRPMRRTGGDVPARRDGGDGKVNFALQSICSYTCRRWMKNLVIRATFTPTQIQMNLPSNTLRHTVPSYVPAHNILFGDW